MLWARILRLEIELGRRADFEGVDPRAIEDDVFALIACTRILEEWIMRDPEFGIEKQEIEESSLCRAFVSNYVPSRGYGFGARRVLEAMEEGRDYRQVAESHFPGGSFGNGAAMRVAPVGLLFRDDPERLCQEARLSALPTHTLAPPVEANSRRPDGG